MKKKQESTRRNFIKKTAMGSAVLGTLSSFDVVNSFQNDNASKEGKLQLKMTGYQYSRLKGLYDGKVKMEDCSYIMEKSGGIGDMNTDVFMGPQSYDVSEIGMVPFILSYANDGFRDYTLLPMFPLRMFRHKSIFVRSDGSIKQPKDLKGKKIGTPGYSSSSLTWIRGMLLDEYGLSPNDVEWVVAKKDSSADVSGKVSKNENLIPEGIRISEGSLGKDESELLLTGEVDALFHAVQPKAFIQGDPRIKRLFDDSKKVEQDYFSKTGIFPIMHAVAVRKSLIQENPWLSESLFNAFSASKTMDYNYMMKLGWAFDTLPWYGQEFEETKKKMGKNFWPYGIEANRKTLETLCRYCYEQGFIKKKIGLEDLFAANSFELKEGV